MIALAAESHSIERIKRWRYINPYVTWSSIRLTDDHVSPIYWLPTKKMVGRSPLINYRYILRASRPFPFPFPFLSSPHHFRVDQLQESQYCLSLGTILRFLPRPCQSFLLCVNFHLFALFPPHIQFSFRQSFNRSPKALYRMINQYLPTQSCSSVLIDHMIVWRRISNWRNHIRMPRNCRNCTSRLIKACQLRGMAG